MAGTRTAPAATAAANRRYISIHMIDASGDQLAHKLAVAIAATAAAIEAWIAAYQAATNSSVYEYTDTLIRSGEALTANAVAAYRGGVENGVNLLFKNPGTLDTFGVRVIAPVSGDMSALGDAPDVAGTLLQDVIDTTTALAAGYDFSSAQYTSRRERRNNSRVR